MFKATVLLVGDVAMYFRACKGTFQSAVLV